MGYLHINNLYKDPTVLMFKEVYALEKIHGTSAHITFNPADGSIRYFSGGTAHATFVALFNETELLEKLKACAFPVDKTVTIYGESYGGKEQGMSLTYGKVGKFIVFDVQIGDCWLDVPNAETIAKSLGLEFVHYTKVTTDLSALDAERDTYSIQAVRNGVSTMRPDASGKLYEWDNPRPREGIVIRPLKEMTLNSGNRVIAKHKGAAFSETATTRHVETDPSKLAQLAEAEAVANEWVTPMRLQHVLDKIPGHDMSKMREILNAMVEDVTREGAGEIDWTKDPKGINKAITRRTSVLYKEYLNSKIGASI